MKHGLLFKHAINTKEYRQLSDFALLNSDECYLGYRSGIFFPLQFNETRRKSQLRYPKLRVYSSHLE